MYLHFFLLLFKIFLNIFLRKMLKSKVLTAQEYPFLEGLFKKDPFNGFPLQTFKCSTIESICKCSLLSRWVVQSPGQAWYLNWREEVRGRPGLKRQGGAPT